MPNKVYIQTRLTLPREAAKALTLLARVEQRSISNMVSVLVRRALHATIEEPEEETR